MHVSPHGKRYIGITSQDPPEKRWGRGGYEYRPNKHFWSAICRYGWDNFNHIILCTGLTFDEACIQ